MVLHLIWQFLLHVPHTSSFISIFYSKFRWRIISVVQQIYEILALHSLCRFIIIIIKIISIICYCFSGGMYFSLGIIVGCGQFFWIFMSIFCSHLCNILCNIISNQIPCCFCCFLDHPLWDILKSIACRLFCCAKKILPMLPAQILVQAFVPLYY